MFLTFSCFWLIFKVQAVKIAPNTEVINMRISIEVTPDQHQQLKAAAALQGKSIKNYVLERTLPNANEQKALNELEAFLKTRLDTLTNQPLSEKSVEKIFDEVHQEKR